MSDKTIENPKVDHRPALLGWEPGGYSVVCRGCGDHFIGDKRASRCADCAYRIQAGMPQPPVLIKVYKRILQPGANRIEGMSRPLSVGVQNGNPVLWYVHDDTIKFGGVRVVLTGQDCPAGDFIGTFQIADGDAYFAGHVFNCK